MEYWCKHKSDRLIEESKICIERTAQILQKNKDEQLGQIHAHVAMKKSLLRIINPSNPYPLCRMWQMATLKIMQNYGKGVCLVAKALKEKKLMHRQAVVGM